jgi:cystathionine gamma-synthase
MSAIHLVTTVFLKPGDLLVAPHDCYGGSYRLFDSLAKRGCYRVLFVDQNDEQALKQALAEKPKLVLVESPSNPLLRVVDIAKICQLARDAGAISVVDNTFLSPALQNPLALGADLVLHSCTKYLNGHSDVVAGVVIAKDPDVVTELAWWANNIGVTAAPSTAICCCAASVRCRRAWKWRSVMPRRLSISENPAAGEEAVSPVAAGKPGA